MDFVKGIMVGSLVSAGVMWACTEHNMTNAKKMVKKSKRFFRGLVEN